MAFDAGALPRLATPIRDGQRPSPPPVDGQDRPSPPPVGGDTYQRGDRPTPPPVSRNSDRPSPPPVSNRPSPPPVGRDYDRPMDPPRYHWMPTYPIYHATNPQPLPRVARPGAPAPARKVDISEVTTDSFNLLAGEGRLRNQWKLFWIFPIHSKVNAEEAKSMLASGKPLFLGPDGGWHGSSSYQPVSDAKQLDPHVQPARERALGEMQDAENRAFNSRVSQWNQTNVSNHEAHLPSFNSVYDTNRLALDNMMVTQDGRQFNRNLITAMNVYGQADTRREIARKWADNPELSTADFNRMANGIVVKNVQNLGWNANYNGNWGSYLGTNPVPGLRYPDYQRDVEWNADVIRRVASEVPYLLNNAVLQR